MQAQFGPIQNTRSPNSRRPDLHVTSREATGWNAKIKMTPALFLCAVFATGFGDCVAIGLFYLG